jgi:hypothetical protein
MPFTTTFLSFLVAALFACFAAPVQAQSKGKEVSGLVGKRFSVVREKLLADGWTPAETNLTIVKGAPERERGEAAKFFAAGYTEIERCTGGARNYCFLNYKRRSTCLRVRTLGKLDLPAADPKVHGTGDDCPSRQRAPR